MMFTSNLYSFEKVVIWGHKSPIHTHYHIHHAFYDTFKVMGYDTYWFDDEDNVTDFDFSESLFLTEGQVDKQIPIREDCEYLLHNCDQLNYKKISPNRVMVFQVYTDAVLERKSLTCVAPCIYYDLSGRCVYMPWATDLLPEQIEQVKQSLHFSKDQKDIVWVGTMGGGYFGNINQISPFVEAAEKKGILFRCYGNGMLTREENVNVIGSSYMAPTIVGEWQQRVGYVPCRIFKNISYGAMGITNSLRVYELFDRKIIYNPDSEALFYDAVEQLKTVTIDDLCALMDIVKEKHTYINRIHTLLDFLEKVRNHDY